MIAQFSTHVTDILQHSRVAGRQRWLVSLEATDFAPGQTGILEAAARSGARIEVPVLEVLLDPTGILWHLVEKPLAAGTKVTGQVLEAVR